MYKCIVPDNNRSTIEFCVMKCAEIQVISQLSRISANFMSQNSIVRSHDLPDIVAVQCCQCCVHQGSTYHQTGNNNNSETATGTRGGRESSQILISTFIHNPGNLKFCQNLISLTNVLMYSQTILISQQNQNIPFLSI